MVCFASSLHILYDKSNILNYHRITDILNHNNGVKILAEPIGYLAPLSKINPNKTNAASIEVDTLIYKLNELINSTSSYTSSRSNSMNVIGFNEKLLYPKFELPKHLHSMEKLAIYMKDKNFKYTNI
jgi:hypothetical protein